MTLPQVYELTDYWQKHPPTHLLLAGYVGYKSKPEVARPSSIHLAADRGIGAPPSDLRALFDRAPGGVCNVQNLEGFV